jgi:hypothetical protein
MSLVQVELDFVTQLKIGNVLASGGLNSLKLKCHVTRRIQESKAYLFVKCIYKSAYVLTL